MHQAVRTLICFLILCQQLLTAQVSRDTSNTKRPKRRLAKQLQIQTYEDNLFGYTSDSDDRPFVDVTLSVQARLYPFDFLMNMMPKKRRQDLHLNVAFTGRFGQYIGTRYSSPVIEKRLNPVLFLQYSPSKKYQNVALQLGYGHESNGQAIDDSVTFFKTAALEHNTVDQTKDKISRGWDYVAFSFISEFFPKKHSRLVFETDVSLKYYLNYGLMQGKKEEYYAWEKSWYGADYSRNNVSGISLSFACLIDSFFINKIRINYETGIVRSFYTNSIKFLVGFNIGNLPLAFTYRYGYNGDLAQFGKVNHSLGFAYILSTYSRPDDKRKPAAQAAN